MKTKPATKTGSATASLMTSLASSIESNRSRYHACEPDTAAALLVEHLSTRFAEDELARVTDLLSNAVDLAKEKIRAGGGRRLPVVEPDDPSYWLG